MPHVGASKGKHVRSHTKSIACSVYDDFERESKKVHQEIVKLKKKMVDATRLGKRIVNILAEHPWRW